MICLEAKRKLLDFKKEQERIDPEAGQVTVGVLYDRLVAATSHQSPGLGALIEDRFQARTDGKDAQAAKLAAFLALVELVSVKRDQLFPAIDPLPGQAGDVGLAAARFPQHVVLKPMFQVLFAGHDLGVLLRRNRHRMLLFDLGPFQAQNDQHCGIALGSHQKIVENAAQIETAFQTTQEIVKHLTKQIHASWIMLAFGFGMALEYMLLQLQPSASLWADILVFALGAGLIQGLSRWNWKFGRKQAEEVQSTVKTDLR